MSTSSPCFAAPTTLRFCVFSVGDATIDELCSQMQQFTASEPTLVDYLWQRQAFSMDVAGGDVATPPHLIGSLDFGDCIDDEWMAVWILRKFTEKHAGAIATVVDEDGEFLLIEAANTLPEWLTPQRSANRVFIVNGKLHLIPQEVSSPTLRSSLALLRASAAQYVFERGDRAIQERLGGFPELPSARSKHHVRVMLHWAAAELLQRHPRLVAAAIEAFCSRDPIESRQCHTMAHWPCSQRRTWHRLRLSRCLFAQATWQRASEPLAFTQHWPAPPNDDDRRAEGRKLGVRIMCGLEILCQRRVPTIAGDDVLQMRRDVFDAQKKDAEARGEEEDCHPNHHQKHQHGVLVDFDELEADDDDSWMKLSLEEVEMMAAKYAGDADRVAPEIVSQMNAFVAGESGVDGFEGDEAHMSFDVGEFMKALQGAGDEGDDGDAVSVDDDDELFAEEHEDPRLRSYMDQMDAEIGTRDAIFAGLEKSNDDADEEGGGDGGRIDVDLNLVKNMLEAYSSQMGEAGPASNLMQSLGVHLPNDADLSSQ